MKYEILVERRCCECGKELDYREISSSSLSDEEEGLSSFYCRECSMLRERNLSEYMRVQHQLRPKQMETFEVRFRKRTGWLRGGAFPEEK